MNEEARYKIIIIDDNPTIGSDITKILMPETQDTNLNYLEGKLFEKVNGFYNDLPQYEIHYANQAQEGINLISSHLQQNDPFALAFVDIRMPHGLDGVETIERIWQFDKSVQVIICTAYSDYSWEEIVSRLGATDNLLVLKKPFDNIAVHQMAFALTKKWELSKLVEQHLQLLEKKVNKRTAALNRSLSLIEATLDSTSDGIVVTNGKNKFMHCNKRFIEQLGFYLQDHKDKSGLFIDIAEQLKSPSNYLDIMQGIAQKNVDNYILLKFKDGKVYEQYSRPQIINNVIVGSVHCFRDVTERYHHEEALRYQVTHDPLTQLPNRILMYDKLQQAINRANKKNMYVVVLFMDLDRFKLINDSLGHRAGDAVLQNIAMRLINATSREDTVARVGGDEFVILISHKNLDYITSVSQEVLVTLNEPYTMSDTIFNINASIGISVYPQDSDNSRDLLKKADAAMYQAKHTGGNTCLWYRPGMEQQSLKNLEMKTELCKALQNEEFELHYQPQVNLITGEIESVEALIRWRHPTRGLLIPYEFIPFAEKSGLINRIGEWVLKAACKQNKLWQAIGFANLIISVNVSSVQLESYDFIELVQNVLNETQLNPGCLELELTESQVISNDKAMETIRNLSQLGTKIALDDFGTGASNFNYINTLPIDKIKIDRAFIQHIYQDQEKQSIVNAILTIAKHRNIIVTAEGIETLCDYEFLRSQGCTLGQGFYYSHPLPSRSFTFYLKRFSTNKEDE